MKALRWVLAEIGVMAIAKMFGILLQAWGFSHVDASAMAIVFGICGVIVYAIAADVLD